MEAASPHSVRRSDSNREDLGALLSHVPWRIAHGTRMQVKVRGWPLVEGRHVMTSSEARRTSMSKCASLSATAISVSTPSASLLRVYQASDDMMIELLCATAPGPKRPSSCDWPKVYSLLWGDTRLCARTERLQASRAGVNALPRLLAAVGCAASSTAPNPRQCILRPPKLSGQLMMREASTRYASWSILLSAVGAMTGRLHGYAEPPERLPYRYAGSQATS